VLTLRDALGFSGAEVASMLDTTDAAVKATLQRARATLDEHVPTGELEGLFRHFGLPNTFRLGRPCPRCSDRKERKQMTQHRTGTREEWLAARLELPATPPVAYALFAHCFTCSKDTLAAARIASALTAYGIAVLRFDFTGLGASAGEFANTTFSSNVADLVAAAAALRRRRAP